MKSFLIKLVVLFFTIVLPLAAYNYYSDFYGVFRGKLNNRFNEPSIRFIKTRFIFNNPDVYDTFIFGSSRAGKILAHKFNKNAYNFYYSEGLPKEFYQDLVLLLNNGVDVKKVYIALDEFSFMVNPKKHEPQLLRKPYMGTIGEDIPTYIEILLSQPIFSYRKFDIPTTYDVSKSGNPLHWKVDSLIEQNPEKHLNSKKFDNPHFVHGNRTEQTLKDIESIRRLCEDNKIELKVIFNPVYIDTYTQYPFEQIEGIKRGLTDIVDFYDFSGFTELNRNKINFYEANHYRYHIGNLIWTSINRKEKSPYFRLVSGSNIDSLINKEREQYKLYIESTQH